jgi:hypothetical protein
MFFSGRVRPLQVSFLGQMFSFSGFLSFPQLLPEIEARCLGRLVNDFESHVLPSAPLLPPNEESVAWMCHGHCLYGMSQSLKVFCQVGDLPLGPFHQPFLGSSEPLCGSHTRVHDSSHLYLILSSSTQSLLCLEPRPLPVH